MKINFMDLRSQYNTMDDDIRKALDAVLAHGRYIMGPEVTELEAKLGEFCGVKNVIGCSSGTDALLMPLMAYGVGPGDAVFTTPFSFIATAEVVALLGAEPVFVDIDPRTFNIDPAKLSEAIDKVKAEGRLTPKVIIPVDLFGLCADYEAIEKIACDHELYVLEDGAQSAGALMGDRRALSFGHSAATSFYPAKPLGCYGDGGAVFTYDDEFAETLRSIRVHGQGSNKYDNVRVGINGRLDSMQAGILLVKLARFQEELDARQRVADRYNAGLEGVTTPHVPDGFRSAWALYSILSDHRDDLRTHLGEHDIPTVVYYPTCMHQLGVFKHLGLGEGSFPVAEDCSRRIVSLPMHPFLTDDEVDKVIEAVNSFPKS